MKNSVTVRRALLLSSVCLAASAHGAWAADQPAPLAAGPPPRTNSTQESKPAGLPEIIVQARRTDERQQTVPIAISTLTSARLQDAAVTSVQDIQRLVPSLQVNQANTGALDFTIRGSFNGVYNDPGVITYFDDVPIDSRTVVNSLFDLSSVQELKGPQGTLFGRNSTGGAVLFFANKPHLNQSGGYVEGRYGNYNERRVEGAVNMPLGGAFAVRLAGEIERRDGYITSVTQPGLQYGNKDNEAVRLSTLWTPTPNIENYTQFTYYNQHEHHTPEVITSLATPCTGFTNPSPLCLYQPPFNSFLGTGNILAYFNQQQALPFDKTVNNSNNDDFAQRDAVTNSFTWRLGPVTFRNISYYGNSFLDFNNDFDGTPIPVFDVFQPSHTRTFYTETQLFGKAFNNRLDWRVGGVYSVDRTDLAETVYLFPFPVSTSTPIAERDKEDFKSYAVFGQASYDFSDLVKGVSFTAGYRYTWDDRLVKSTTFVGQPTPVCALQTLPVPATGPVPFPNTDLATCTRTLPLKFSNYNYNFTLDWQATDRLLVYAATRRGYKAGSFNQNANDPSLASYQPEINTDYELGLKADWRLARMPVRTNVAVFQENYTDIQAETVTIDPHTGAIQVLVLNQDPVTGLHNKARIRGAEFEVTAAPTSWLQLSGFYSTLSAKYSQFINPASRVNLAGQGIAGVVPETYGVSAEARIPMSGWTSGVGLTASYYGTATPLANSSVPGLTSRNTAIDARISLRDLFGTGADLAFYGKNLTNFDHYTDNPAVAGSITRLRLNEPRTYGVELIYRFGGERR